MMNKSYSDLILPLPHYIHRIKSKDYEEVEYRPMEKIIPMKIFGKIIGITDDGLISYRWIEDDRNLKNYQAVLNEHYAREVVLKDVELVPDTTYIVRYKGNFCRCNIINAFSVRKEQTVYLIDYGKYVQLESADFYYFHHHDSWIENEFRFAFTGVCRIADKNQCLQLGIPSTEQFVEKEEVEIYLLSAAEPCYAVLSSLRNPEAKILDAELTQDLPPEFADSWNDITENLFDLMPAEHPTFSVSPKWIHGSAPVLVTIPTIQSLGKFVVCDLLCSLRACILSEYLHGNYELPHVRQALAVSDSSSQLGIGIIVVAWDSTTDRYYRAQIIGNHPSLEYFDLVGIDFPGWKSSGHPVNELWLLSQTLELFPRQYHLMPYRQNPPFKYRGKLALSKMASSFCPPYTVALLQQRDDSLEPSIIVPDRFHHQLELIKMLPYEDQSRRRWRSISSLSSRGSSKRRGKYWSNKSQTKPSVQIGFNKAATEEKKPLFNPFTQKKKMSTTVEW